MDTKKTALVLKNVTKIYRRGFLARKTTAVDDLSFSVQRGNIVGFIGPNGAGKTTTIKMIMGLMYPSKGSITINGIDASEPCARRKVTYLSEQPYFYRHLDVEESLRFAAHLLGIDSSSINREIDKVLASVGLTEKKKIWVRDLSKGMQQRLSMASALLGDSDIFILDEPMSGMDPLGRRLFRQLFHDLAQKGKTIFFSTHVLEDVQQTCRGVIMLSKGKLVYDGDVASLVAQGILGTEVVVNTLDPDRCKELEQLGYTVTHRAPGTMSHGVAQLFQFFTSIGV